MVKLIQLTNFGSPNNQVETIHGLVLYSVWLELERKRISSAPGRVAEIRRKYNGQVALFVDEVAEINPLQKYDARIKKA